MASLGYTCLVEKYGLDARPAQLCALIDSRIRGRERRQMDGQDILAFEAKYQPEDTFEGHLQFALRYEGINLEILALLFEKTGETELMAWLAASPTSAYARRAGFLYEWLTERKLPVDAVAARERYVPLVDDRLQICLPAKALPNSVRNKKFRVLNNLPGNREFCPLVRRTARLDALMQEDLKRKTRETLAKYDADLLRRAAGYLYLKETHSSFEVERESPPSDRVQRFADLLRDADTTRPLTEERLAELQRAVLDPRFHEFGWRGKQNWLGRDYEHRRQVDFVPPRPADAASLMTGLLALAEESGNWHDKDDGEADGHFDPVILATVIAFGFVFVHPFMDGNGRIHRYLIHEILSRAGFTPRGMVLPISAVILANLDEYIAALEDFSRPLMARTSYNPDLPEIPARGNDAIFFRYFDATRQAEFLYWALQRTVIDDLESEIKYLLGFDRAYSSLNSMVDWPAHSRELFIQIVRQNGYKLSKNKRGSHFDWMKDGEVAEAEKRVAEAFRLDE